MFHSIEVQPKQILCAKIVYLFTGRKRSWPASVSSKDHMKASMCSVLHHIKISSSSLWYHPEVFVESSVSVGEPAVPDLTGRVFQTSVPGFPRTMISTRKQFQMKLKRKEVSPYHYMVWIKHLGKRTVVVSNK